MAISRHGNTIIVPTADSGVAMAAAMKGYVIGVKVKTAGAAGRCIVYSGQAVDAAKVIADVELATLNSFDGIAGLEQIYKDGMNVQVTGAGAIGYVYIK